MQLLLIGAMFVACRMNLHRQPAAFLIILLHLYFCLLFVYIHIYIFLDFEFRQNLISVFCAVGKKIVQNVLHRQLGQLVGGLVALHNPWRGISMRQGRPAPNSIAHTINQVG